MLRRKRPTVRPAPPMWQGAQGTLDLRCRAVDIEGMRRTVVDTVAQTPPLRMIRALPWPTVALVHLHNVSGGVLGGDDLRVHVAVSADAASRSRPRARRALSPPAGLPDAGQQTTFSVGAGGLPNISPDPLIPVCRRRYRQATRLRSSGRWRPLCVGCGDAGREASGEHFAYAALALERGDRGRRAGGLGKIALSPADTTLAAPAALGGYRQLCHAAHVSRAARRRRPGWRWKRRSLLADESTVTGEVVWEGHHAGCRWRRSARLARDAPAHGNAAALLARGQTHFMGRRRSCRENLLTNPATKTQRARRGKKGLWREASR